METKISKAQLEVWEWKNNLYEEIKDIPRLKNLEYIKNKVSKLLKQIKQDKQIGTD